jgi:hypothetical protein
MNPHPRPNPLRSRSLRAMAALAALAVAGGCVGYKLGSTLPPGIESVYVPTFINETGEPFVETETTRAAIQEFQKDGTLRVRDRAVADAILNVTVVEFELEPLRYERDRNKTTDEYRLTLTADVSFARAKDGEVLITRRVKGETDFLPGGDLGSAKRAALPQAARDLAHDIVESVVEYW